MKETILFATLGRTDLQVLGLNNGEKFRLSIERNLRHFHQALLTGDLPYRLDPSGAQCPEAILSDNRVRVEWDVASRDFRFPQAYEEVLSSEAELLLVPGKLAEAIEKIMTLQDVKVIAVVLYTTNRDESTPPSVYHKEPIADGPIIAKWLASEFDLEPSDREGDIGLGQAGWIDILDAGMLSPAPGRDSPVNREALRRVENTMRKSRRWVNGGEAWACLSLGGGMPDFKEPIKACAEYFFEGRTFIWQAPQYSRHDFDWRAPGEEAASPTDSYRVRRHVEGLLRKGAFVEAYGAATELESDSAEIAWVNKVRQAADYVSGRLSSAQPRSKTVPRYLKRLVWPAGTQSSMLRCLLVGVRVEAALSSGRVLEAVAGTATFLDAAILDAVGKSLPPGCVLDDEFQQIRGDSGEVAEVASMVNLNTPPEGRTPMTTNREGKWCYTISRSNLEQWGRLLEDDTNRALSEYREGLDEKHGAIRLINLRHLTVHSVLPAKRIKGIHEAFQDAHLWAVRPAQAGDAFLSRPLVRGVLKSLGIDDGAALYRAFVEGLLSDLRDYEIR